MIITQEDTKRLSKGASVSRNQQQPSHLQMPPPPAYEAASSSSPSQPEHAPPMTSLNAHAKTPLLSREGPRPRFFKAFIVAVILWAAVSLFVTGLVRFFSHRHKLPHTDDGSWGEPVRPDRNDGSIISSKDCRPNWSELITIGDMNTGLSSDQEPLENSFPSSFPFPDGPRGGPWRPPGDRRPHGPPVPPIVYKAKYSLPSRLESLYFLSKGGHSHGTFRYEMAHEDAKTITVDVEMRYWRKDVRESVNMCILQKSKTNMGFGIFTPSINWDWMPGEHRSVRFDVLVRIPSSSFTSSDLSLDALASKLPNFSQFVGEFARHSTWGAIDLQGTNGGIFTKGQLQANNLTLTTSNGPIIGRFFSDSSLDLKTTNGVILADVELQNKQSASQKSSVSLVTSNAKVNASVTLTTLRESEGKYPGTNGDFRVYIKTSNDPVELSIPLAPPSSSIELYTQTSNAHSNARLYRTFEGPFELQTSNAGAHVFSKVGREDDPKHEQREPVLRIRKISNRLTEGEFYWDDSTLHGQGLRKTSSAHVQTSNGPISLSFV